MTRRTEPTAAQFFGFLGLLMVVGLVLVECGPAMVRFLEAHLVVIALVVGVLSVLFLAGLLVWAFWPLNPDHLCAGDECCADELPPCLKEFPNE